MEASLGGRPRCPGPFSTPGALEPRLGRSIQCNLDDDQGDALHFRGMYGILDDIRVSSPGLNERVTSGEPSRIALYEDFFLVGFRLPLHPFILSFLDNYRLVLA